MSDNKAILTMGSDAQDYAIMDGTMGPQVIDVRKLYANTGMFTYDPGFTSTASCDSGLTYIDGDEGVLLHRGYPIGQLAEQSSFMEVSYLLLKRLKHSSVSLADQKCKFELVWLGRSAPETLTIVGAEGLDERADLLLRPLERVHPPARQENLP